MAYECGGPVPAGVISSFQLLLCPSQLLTLVQAPDGDLAVQGTFNVQKVLPGGEDCTKQQCSIVITEPWANFNVYSSGSVPIAFK